MDSRQFFGQAERFEEADKWVLAVDVIFEGRLSNTVGLKQVLKRIADNRIPGTLLLRVTVSEESSGRMVISEGRYITAAALAPTNEVGYQALRKLVQVNAGSFALLAVGKHDNMDIQANLYIELDKVIPLLPNLPPDESGLFEEKALLDKVFGQPPGMPKVVGAPS